MLRGKIGWVRLSENNIELLRRIDEVLHYLWDPIGVGGVPEARDEYSSYAGVVQSMMKKGAECKEISQYLVRIRADHMGRPEESLHEDEIAEILDNWKVNCFSRI